MIIGNYIRALLDERVRVVLPGFGSLEVIVSEGKQRPIESRIYPPGIFVRLDTSFSRDDGKLAEAFATGEEIERDEAQQRVLELVDAIKFSLYKGENFLLPEAGILSRDADGKIHFLPDPSWLLEPEQYGLESMDLLELEEPPIEEENTKESETDSGTASKATVLAPPKPKPKNKKWRLVWVLAVALIVVLVVLIMIPSEEGENVDQTETVSNQAETDTEEQVKDPEKADPVPETQVEQALPVEESNKYFLIAGSFNKLKNASDLQDKLNSRGYNAEVMITENRMYRVSVASYATKEEAEKGLSRIKSEPDLQSSWLLSN